MSDWNSPIKQVDNVLVFGELHRKRPSREALFEAWDGLDEKIGAVCVEVDQSESYRDDGGGAIGGSLVRAEERDIPRYYLDEGSENIIEAFGGKYEAYSYLKKLEDTIPVHDSGLVDEKDCLFTRIEVLEEYGKDAFKALFEERERKMAKRAKWVAERTDGLVILVVGAAHMRPIASYLRGECEPVAVEDKRVREGERIAANQGPVGTMLTVLYREVKRLVEDFTWGDEETDDSI